MIELILLIALIMLFVKLHEMSAKMTLMMGKINSLQDNLHHNQIEDEPIQVHTTQPDKVVEEIPPLPTRPPRKKLFNANIEDFLVGNLLLNISIVAFVLGIGFFLKYSIDRDWIPIWARMFIGISIAFGMIVASIKIGDKRPKLFT